MKLIYFLVPSLLFAAPVSAETKLRGEIFCFSAKNVPKMIDRLSRVDASRRDVVDVNLDPKFLIKDSGVWPEQYYLARDGEVVVDLPFSKTDGRVPTFISAVKANLDTDICVKDPSRADRPEYDEGLYFEMGLSPLYHNRSGRHDMAELKEGTKDGKKFYKQMIPKAVRMFMPDTDYLAVKYDDFRLTSDIYALVGDREIRLEPELYKEMHVVSFEGLEDMGATALIVRGGAYHLQPTVSVKTMKRFGWGQDEEDEK